MKKYRIEYKQSRYKGIYGSGDTGWEYSHFTRVIEKPTDELAVLETKEFIDRFNSPHYSTRYTLLRLVRIDREEEITEISFSNNPQLMTVLT